MSKTIYFIRHAESEENRRLGSLKSCLSTLVSLSLPSYDDVSASLELINIPGQVNTELSVIGKKQVAHMAEFLKKADFVTKHKIQLVAHSPLIRAKETANVVDHPVILETELLTEKTPAEWIPGNSASLYQRIQDLQEWLCQRAEENIVLVGHSQFFRAMLGLDFKFDNCSVWKAHFDGKSWQKLEKVYDCQVPDAVVPLQS